MLSRTAVFVTAMICGTILVLSFVGALIVLALNNRSTEVLTLVVIVPVVSILIAVLRRVAKIEEKAEQIKVLANGNTSRLIEAVVAAPAQPATTEVS